MKRSWKTLSLFVLVFLAAMATQGLKAAQPTGRAMRSLPANNQTAVDRSSESDPREILVWKVGDPHTGKIPDTSISSSLSQTAGKMGFRITVRAFPPAGFARQFFDAFNRGQEPDILAINNYGIIDGTKTALGDFTGIGTDKAIREKLVKVTESLKGLNSGGWEFLVASSNHANAAKSLALRSIDYGPHWGFMDLSEGRLKASPLSKDLQESAAVIARAYLQGDRMTLAAFEDRDRLHAEAEVLKQFDVMEIKVLKMWGDSRLAFVPVASIYKSAKQLGQMSMLLILRKQDSQWKLLVASADPISLSMGGMSALLMSLRQTPMPREIPIPAKLLEPKDGQFPAPPKGERFGAFVWQPSTSSDVAAQIVEFAYKDDVRLIFPHWFQENNQVSAGMLWTIYGPWKWRVWSISGSGAISFSEARSFIMR
jgi:hypothetical protein